MTATNKERLAKTMRLFARIIGLAIAVFGLIFGMSEAGTHITETEGFKVIALYLQSFLMGSSAIIALVGCIISWWRVLPAGILLILAGVALPVIVRLPASFRTPSTSEETPVIMALIAGSPFVVAGVLFLWSWWLLRKTP
jgi:hypothetical protein